MLFLNSQNNMKCEKLYLQALLVTNSRENWLRLFWKAWRVKFEHVETDVQVHLFVARVAGKQLKARTRSYMNGIQLSRIESRPKTPLIWMQRTAASACTLEMSFQKWADSWGAQERRVCNSEGACNLYLASLFFSVCVWRVRWRGARMSVPLGYDISHSFSLDTPRLGQKNVCVWVGGYSGRMPGDVNPHPGNGKTSLGSFLDGVWSLFRTQSLLNHLTSSVLHSLHHPHPSLSLSVSLPSLCTLSPPNTTSV